jgi:RNA polymerase sigma factor (sigma-70 family)
VLIFKRRVILKVAELIEHTARQIVAELKKVDLIKTNKLGTFKKTEKVLYEYPNWKDSNGKETKRLVKQIDKALERIESDPYYDLIELKYFKGWTHEKIAEHFDIDEKAVRYHRQKLIEKLRPIIFSDEFIHELIFDL